jgi:hypothetical protein
MPAVTYYTLSELLDLVRKQKTSITSIIQVIAQAQRAQRALLKDGVNSNTARATVDDIIVSAKDMLALFSTTDLTAALTNGIAHEWSPATDANITSVAFDHDMNNETPQADYVTVTLTTTNSYEPFTGLDIAAGDTIRVADSPVENDKDYNSDAWVVSSVPNGYTLVLTGGRAADVALDRDNDTECRICWKVNAA